MRRALQLARRSWGDTHPNPMVGAVLIEGDRIVAEGWHARSGAPHAEIIALQRLNRRPQSDATLFLTLEPCSTVGKTPACTDLILRSGIQHVVIGAIDPNPKHAGRGIELLKKASIQVTVGLLASECNDLNLIYNHWITTQKPLFAVKIATTLDGRMATHTGDSKWITGEVARNDVMQWRRLFPAIAVGAGTVLADNPRLTSRIGDDAWSPLRFVFDRQLKTVRQPLPHLYTDTFRHRTVVVCDQHCPSAQRKVLASAAITLWSFDTPNESATLATFRSRCQQEGIIGVLYEGGSFLLTHLLAANEIDYLFAYRAPKLLADKNSLPVFGKIGPDKIKDALTLQDVQHALLGPDQLMRGWLR